MNLLIPLLILLSGARTQSNTGVSAVSQSYIIAVPRGRLEAMKQILFSLLDGDLKYKATYVRTEPDGNMRVTLRDSKLLPNLILAYKAQHPIIVPVPPLANASQPISKRAGYALNLMDPESLSKFVESSKEAVVPSRVTRSSQTFETRDHIWSAWKDHLREFGGTRDPQSVLANNARALAGIKGLTLPPALRAQSPRFDVDWKAIGPSNVNVDAFDQYNGKGAVSGRFNAVAIADPHTIYAGAGIGGVWKKQDNAADKTWHYLSSSWNSITVSSIVCDPVHAGTVFVGTGDFNLGFHSYGNGVEMSTDGGNSWVTSPDPLNVRIGYSPVAKLLLDPGDEATHQPAVLVALGGMGADTVTQHYICRCVNPSDNSGFQSWTDSGPNIYASFCDGDIGVPDPKTNKRTMYAVGHVNLLDPVIYYSNDQGLTWLQSSIQLPKHPDDQLSRLAIVASKVVPGVAYLLDPKVPQIYATVDGGKGWTPIHSTYPDLVRTPYEDITTWSQLDYNCYLACAPTADHKDRLLLGLIDLMTTIVDSQSLPESIGQNQAPQLSWTSLGGPTYQQSPASFAHNDQHCAGVFTDAKLASTIVVGNDGGVFRLDPDNVDPGKRWSSLNEPELTICSANWSYSPAKGHVLVSTQDTGAIQGTAGAWAYVFSGDSGFCGGEGFVEFALGYLEDSFSSMDVYYTRDRWAHTYDGWFQVDPSEAHPFYPVGAYSDIDKTLYVGTNLLHYCVLTDGVFPNSGQGQPNWLLDTPPTNPPATVNITAICPVPNVSLAVFVGYTDGSLWSKDPASGAWTQVNSGMNSLPPQGIICLSSRSGNADDLIVGVTGQGVGHLWRCKNMSSAQRTWSSVSINHDFSADVIVNSLVRDPRDPDTVWYAATDGGVYMTADGGANWQDISRPTAGIGLPACDVTSVQVNKDGELFATTSGMGVYVLPLPALQSK